MTTSNTALSQKTLNGGLLGLVRLAGARSVGTTRRCGASGYCYAMMPALKEIYTNEDDLQVAVKNHLQFFNTTPDMAFVNPPRH